MNGEIYFDMTEQGHPVMDSSKCILKRWTRHTIYSKSGSYNRTENPTENLYKTNSIYLYDYIAVSKDFFATLVHTESQDTFVPGSVGNHDKTTTWTHYPNTFKSSPNMATNNYTLTASNFIPPNTFTYDIYVKIDTGMYFELVNGYPRNHFTHKRDLFSLYNTKKLEKLEKSTSEIYYRNRQTSNSTVGIDGLEDGSSPVQATEVGNLNLVQTDNVINH